MSDKQSQTTKWTRTETLLLYTVILLGVNVFGLVGIMSWCKVIGDYIGVP